MEKEERKPAESNNDKNLLVGTPCEQRFFSWLPIEDIAVK